MCYFYSCLIAIKEGMSFRVDFIIRFLTGFLYNYANVAIIFYIMLANNNVIDSLVFNDSLNYIILSSTISAAFFFSVPPGEVTQKIINGDIVREILYPYSYIGALFSQCIGRFLSIIFSRLLLSIVILSVVFAPEWQIDISRIFAFMVLLFIGYGIYFFISTTIDLISFWRQETYYFHFIKEGLFLILSGSTIPMWFYPKFLFDAASYLPFKWMIYGPIAFLLNKFDINFYFNIVIIMLVWLLAVISVCLVVWKLGIKKVVAFGG